MTLHAGPIIPPQRSRATALAAWAVDFPGAGLVAGVVALGLLEAATSLLAPGWQPASLEYLLAYALCGVLVGTLRGVAALRAGDRDRSRRAFAHTLAVTVAVLYAALLYERVYDAARFRIHALQHGASAFGTLQAAACAGGALLGYAGWIALLRRLAKGASAAAATLLGALSVALLLLVDRHVFPSALSAPALFAAATLLATTVGLAMLVRNARTATLLGAALPTLFFCAVALQAGRSSPATTPAGVARPSATPDLILIVIDTLRADVFDRVVRESQEGVAFRVAMQGSAWFRQAVAVSPWTLPSMGSLMTGSYPGEHGLGRAAGAASEWLVVPLSGEVRTLAEQLRAADYATVAIGANHILNPQQTRIHRGFAHYEILPNEMWKFPLFRLVEWLGLYTAEPPYRDASAIRRRLRSQLAALADTTRPLFLWLQLMDSHAPLRRHASELSPDPAAAHLPDLDREYRDTVRYALRELVLMIDLLRGAGRWENSVVVVTSDHGELLPSDAHHPWVQSGGEQADSDASRTYGHGHVLYDALLRVPLVIRPPGGLGAERDVAGLVNQADVHRTISSLLHLPPGRRSDAVDLSAWLAARPPDDGSAVRSASLAGAPARGADQRALLTPRLKVIQYPNGEHPPELYDRQSDPGEMNNLAASDPEGLRSALALLERHWSALSIPSPDTPRSVDPGTRERLRALGYVE